MPLQVTPKSTALRASEPQIFQATGGTGTVVWWIQPARGRIDAQGVYTAPKWVLRSAQVTVLASDATQFDAASVTLEPGGIWIHFLGAYWLAWALILLWILFARWESLCPNCRPAELLVSPPLATVTASQPVRFTANAPVAWQETMNSSGLYIAPLTQPPNSSINIIATAISDAKKTASASLIWSPDIGITLEPQNATVFGQGTINFNAVVTAAPGKPGTMDLSQADVEWLQPSIGTISAKGKGTAVYDPGTIEREATIMIMANVRSPGGLPRPAGSYITLLPRDPGKVCREDGTPGMVNLIALIAAAGALGGLIHGASSFAIFTGNREFKSSWTWWYVLRPVLGAAVALVVYLVVRGGLGNSDVVLLGTDCLKIAGFAGLIGMFAEPATLKLKDIFNTLFTPREDQRKDRLAKATPEKASPHINSIDPQSVPANSAAMLKIAGRNFAPGCVVKIGANARAPRSITPDWLVVDLQPGDVATPGYVPIRVWNTPAESDSSDTVILRVV